MEPQVSNNENIQKALNLDCSLAEAESESMVQEPAVVSSEIASSSGLESEGERDLLMVELVFFLLDQIIQQIHPSQLMWLMSLMMIQVILLAWVSQIERALQPLKALIKSNIGK